MTGWPVPVRSSNHIFSFLVSNFVSKVRNLSNDLVFAFDKSLSHNPRLFFSVHGYLLRQNLFSRCACRRHLSFTIFYFRLEVLGFIISVNPLGARANRTRANFCSFCVQDHYFCQISQASPHIFHSKVCLWHSKLTKKASPHGTATFFPKVPNKLHDCFPAEQGYGRGERHNNSLIEFFISAWKPLSELLILILSNVRFLTILLFACDRLNISCCGAIFYIAPFLVRAGNVFPCLLRLFRAAHRFESWRPSLESNCFCGEIFSTLQPIKWCLLFSALKLISIAFERRVSVWFTAPHNPGIIAPFPFKVILFSRIEQYSHVLNQI